DAVSVAPPDAFASTTIAVGPVKTGSVRCTVAAASARPEPDRLSGCPVVFNENALVTTVSRSAVRAATGSSRPLPPSSRHGAPCTASAAIAATCGVAADVPKKSDPNAPAPVTDTPSIAETSGFCRPSSVGPRLLKNSIVMFVVSMHDALVFEPNALAAEADAE